MKKILAIGMLLGMNLVVTAAMAHGPALRIPANERYLAGQCKANEVVFMGLCVDRKETNRR